MTKISNQK